MRVYYISYQDYEPLQHRVVKSAHLLDIERPGWEKEIDVAKLRAGKDVLEQLFGSHAKGRKTLRIVECEHGFKTRYMHESPEDLIKFWEFQILWRFPIPVKMWLD